MKIWKTKAWKNSIQFKMVAISTILIVFTIFICWFVNRTFLISYYEHSRTVLLGDTYKKINEVYNNQLELENDAEADPESDSTANSAESESAGDIFNPFGDSLLNKISESDDAKGTNENAMKDEVALTLERLSNNKNMSLYVFDIYYNLQNIFLKVSYPPERAMTLSQQEILSERVKEYYADDTTPKNDKSVLKQSKQYSIYKVFDRRIKSQYIELFGRLDNGSTIYIRSNLESMAESVEVANKFLAFVGLFAAIVGSIIMYFISRSFVDPILELSDIAKKMSDLDFDVKYIGKTEDEIGILGNSVNTLSEKLEATISELKTANNELQTDIQNKIEIDEMRKEFLSNVSHELKTPIALIQGYAEGLKENVNDDEDSRDFYCEVIMDEATKMNKMVKKLLSLNQIEFGNNQVNFERFDIVAVLKSVLSSTEILFQQKNVHLIFEQFEPIYVWADEYMIEEVITNYISNALNHVDYENEIRVSLEKKDNVVRVSVYNTGKPIPEDEINNVWIKFYKVDKARTREYGGSGIGLSIVKAIMTSHNRECGAINRENGVEFWFELDCKI